MRVVDLTPQQVSNWFIRCQATVASGENTTSVAQMSCHETSALNLKQHGNNRSATGPSSTRTLKLMPTSEAQHSVFQTSDLPDLALFSDPNDGLSQATKRHSFQQTIQPPANESRIAAHSSSSSSFLNRFTGDAMSNRFTLQTNSPFQNPRFQDPSGVLSNAVSLFRSSISAAAAVTAFDSHVAPTQYYLPDGNWPQMQKTKSSVALTAAEVRHPCEPLQTFGPTYSQSLLQRPVLNPVAPLPRQWTPAPMPLVNSGYAAGMNAAGPSQVMPITAEAHHSASSVSRVLSGTQLHPHSHELLNVRTNQEDREIAAIADLIISFESSVVAGAEARAGGQSADAVGPLLAGHPQSSSSGTSATQQSLPSVSITNQKAPSCVLPHSIISRQYH